MAEVQWIKIKVGMFDGESFKRIKKASIGGESFRDKLTAVWFELLDLGGKCNHNGLFINDNEIAYKSISDIAVMIDRDEEELNLCLQFYIQNGMVEIVDDVYKLSNWEKYQNIEGLENIREQNRARVQKFRENKKVIEMLEKNECNVTSNVTGNVTSYSYSNSLSNSNSLSKDIKYKDLIINKLFEYKNVDLRKAIIGFIDMRIKKKEAMTQHAFEVMLEKLNKMTDDELEKIDIINQSVMNNWQGIFPLKDENRIYSQNGKSLTDDEVEEEKKETKGKYEMTDEERAIYESLFKND